MNTDFLKNAAAFLDSNQIPYEKDVSLRETSYFRTGGMVKLIVFPRDTQQLQGFIKFMTGEKYEYKVIGATSNLLFLDDRKYGVFLSLDAFKRIEINADGDQIIVGAGTDVPEFSRQMLRCSFAGFEGLEGIPGTIGGAVYMNAGAYGCEIKDHLLFIEAIDTEGNLCMLSNEELRFSNRNSILREQKKHIIVQAVFRGIKGSPERIYGRMELYHAKRHKYQDFIYPTLGSVFSKIDIYKELGREDLRYRILLKAIRTLFYSKKFRRERPMNQKLLNRFVCRYFGWNFDIQPFSDKTMNCLANKGMHSDVFIDFIGLMKEYLPPTARLENEIVDSCLIDEPCS